MKHFNLTILLLLTVTSCVREINLEHLRPQPKLVLNSFVIAGEPIAARVSRTWFYTENYPDVTIADATVHLYVNGGLKEQMVWTKDGDSHYDRGRYQAAYIPKEGDEIKIMASVENYKDVSAEISIPELVPIIRVTTSVVKAGTSGSSYDQLKVGITFKDDPDRKNYYLIYFESRGLTRDNETQEVILNSIWSPLSVDYSKEPLLLSSFSALESVLGYDFMSWVHGRVFTDDLINGQEYTIQVLTGIYSSYWVDSPMPEDPDNSRVCLYSISESYYQYLKSIIALEDEGLQGSMADKGLAEPIPIFSNISGGVGILGAGSQDKATFNRIIIE